MTAATRTVLKLAAAAGDPLASAVLRAKGISWEPDLRSCAAYGALCDRIDALQSAGRYDEAGPLCEIRAEFDSLHLGHEEAL